MGPEPETQKLEQSGHKPTKAGSHKLEEARSKFSSKKLQRSYSLAITLTSVPWYWFWTSGLQNSERIHSCCFKSPAPVCYHSHRKLIHSTPTVLISESSASSLLSSQKGSVILQILSSALSPPGLAHAVIINTTGWWLKQEEFICHHLVTGSPKSRHQHGWVMVKPL